MASAAGPSSTAPPAEALEALETCVSRCHKFAMGDWPVRWVVLCSWTYIFTTAAGFVLALVTSPAYGGYGGLVLNWNFYVIYSLTYWSFIVQFVFMYPRLPRLYMLGVASYTFGYTLIAGYYSLSMLEADAPRTKIWLNFAGSQLFLWGSVSLIRPTYVFAGGATAPWKQPSSLLWGSTCFLLGSAFFVHDSARMALGGAKHRQWEVAAGMAFFLAGRLFFLRGSQAPQCDWLFRDLRGGLEVTASGSAAKMSGAASSAAQVTASGSDVPGLQREEQGADCSLDVCGLCCSWA